MRYLKLNVSIMILCFYITNISAQQDYVKRINCGSNTPADYNNKTFDADVEVPGEVSFDGELDYNSSYLTLQQPLKSIRYTKGESMHYRFQLDNGRYAVKLYFAEPFHGIAPGTDPETRKFNVDVEGQITLTDLNIISAGGGPDQVYILAGEVQLADGELTMTFSKGSGNDPIINAIEVIGLPLSSGNANDYVKRINCGSDEEAEYNFVTFDPDINMPGEVEFDGERSYPSSYLTLPEPMRSVRYTKNSAMHYRFMVPNGHYRTVLHFSEPHHGLAPNTDPDTRKFDVDIEGQASISELNVYSASGGANKVYKMDRTVEVSDGELTITFSKGSGNDPMVNAIEVIGIDLSEPEPLGKLVFVYDMAGNQIRRGPGAKEEPGNGATALKARIPYSGDSLQEGEETSKEEFKKGIRIFPNPTQGELSMNWTELEGADLMNISVFDTGNRSVPVQHKKGSNSAYIDLGRYPPGLYIVTFRLSDGSSVMEKILKK
ncbi:malectin domain-containing carbohydrate-binding protein [Zobellia uliginosa]|uniref:malectin domain-containing carbohydrate-binding protein n=1 Tax=Zobellia uliginosa TaxID=143224 RepID=UPI0026E39C7A|nr:malectin domain-containing carbohydrate-binding protein [Zobellia uliginosa]MDO6517798.1 malectin domain-containing carbohydrate-binding protein [Zobellia uliginosa]